MRALYEFLLSKTKQMAETDRSLEASSVSMFYEPVNQDFNLHPQETFTDVTDKKQYNNSSGSPNRQ